MSTEVLIYVAAVCLVSGFAHGAIGFGFPVVATPLVALVRRFWLPHRRSPLR